MVYNNIGILLYDVNNNYIVRIKKENILVLCEINDLHIGDIVKLKYVKLKDNNDYLYVTYNVIKFINFDENVIIINNINCIDNKSNNVVFNYINDLDINIYNLEKNIINYNYNDKLIVMLYNWNYNNNLFTCKVIKKIGYYKYNITELKCILFSNNIDNKHTNNNDIYRYNYNNNKNVFDVSNHFTITIDPEDAKDHDDAISIKKINKNNWIIGIHISDVTNYIKLNSYLDKVSYNKSSTIYLYYKIFSMLPKILSNNICSLIMDNYKKTISMIFKFNNDGICKNFFLKETIIRSNVKFDYKYIDKIIKNKNKNNIFNKIFFLYKICNILRKNRISKGSFNFKNYKNYIILNKYNVPIYSKYDIYNHSKTIVEELMLLTNKKILFFIKKYNLFDNEFYVYRIHKYPDIYKINKLKEKLKYFNLKMIINKKLSDSLNILLKKINKFNKRNIVEDIIIKHMNKAKYSIDNIGHYGLSFDCYTHFTSPIRRYLDIIVHRLLKNILYININNCMLYKYYNNIYKQQCTYCSKKEEDIMYIEKVYDNYLKLLYINRFVNFRFKATILDFKDGLLLLKLLNTTFECYIDKKLFLLKKINTDNVNNFIGKNIYICIKEISFMKKEIKLN